MTFSDNDNERLLTQNIDTYSNAKADNYQADWQYVFEEKNQARILQIIKKSSRFVKKQKALDVGVGSGNVYNNLNKIFEKVEGIDLSIKMALERGIDSSLLYEGNCEKMPFRDSEYNYMSAYAVVHHLLNPIHFFKESYRCLDERGILYIDGDKNRNFFYPFSKSKYIFSKITGKKDVDYWKNYLNRAEWAGDGEYHYGGFHKKELVSLLHKAGFRKVKFFYRTSLNKQFTDSPLSKILRKLRIKPFYSHFFILAFK